MIDLQKFVISKLEYDRWKRNGVLQLSTGKVLTMNQALDLVDDIAFPQVSDYEDSSDYEYDCIRSLKPLIFHGLYPADVDFYIINELEDKISYITHKISATQVIIIIAEYYE